MTRSRTNPWFLSAPALVGLALIAFACNGGGEEALPTSTLAPEPTATPEAAAETLAFVRDGDIWLVDADGGNERRLGLSNVREFSWVSSQELDVVIDGDAPDAIDGDEPGHVLVDTEGNVSDLPFPAGGSWSNNETMYVVAVDQQIVVFDRGGGEVARLDVAAPVEEGPKATNCGPDDPSVERDRLIFSRPVLSPDNERILVAVNCLFRAGATGNLYAPVYEVSLADATQRPLDLQTNLEDVTAARFSPDGRRVGQAIRYGGSACASEFSLFVADADGANSEDLTLPAVVDARLRERAEVRGGLVGYDWSPESNAIVASFNVSLCVNLETEPYVMVEPVLAGLYILKLDGSSGELLLDGATYSPAWSPSGRSIAYVAGESFGETEPPELHVLELSSGQSIDLGRGSQPAWQPQP